MAKNESDQIEKLRKRDPVALEALVRQHTKHLYKACLGLGFNEVEAEDVMQSVWITFFNVVAQFDGRSTVRTFLFGILYNKASEHRRQVARAEATENIEDVLDSHFDSKGHWIAAHSPVHPDKFLESTQTMSLIARCLELLPSNQKMAFLLKEVEDEMTDEICKILSVTATNLGVLLFRARVQLRECVDRKSR
ncbi:MAG: sigma-70 family RNA polymerase sigma factor [Bdellovibrionales bacterium]|nr:sigma-70 family RNA polymerase sigma factor [Bdellovibrionales bacterium]